MLLYSEQKRPRKWQRARVCSLPEMRVLAVCVRFAIIRWKKRFKSHRSAIGFFALFHH
jgi:hypothetical protein